MREILKYACNRHSQEERQMEQLTREIGRSFSNGYRQVQTIKSAGRHESKPAERRLAASAVMALSTALQELGLRYRQAQNHYLTRMFSRRLKRSRYNKILFINV